ncbi:MAG: hypothetical protein RLY30_1215 [Pseudomonadota bacterium]|jgi:voltage-gated potassium channel
MDHAALRSICHSLYGQEASAGRWPPIFLAVSTALSLLNLAALWLEYKFGVSGPHAQELASFAQFSLWFFAADFLLRLLLSPYQPTSRQPSSRLRFLIRPTSLLQLASFAPSLLLGVSTDLRALRLYLLLWPLRPAGPVWRALRHFLHTHRHASFRRKLYLALNPTRRPDPLQKIIELSQMVTILCALVLVVAESIASLAVFAPEFAALEMVLVTLFTIEYVARIYSIKEDPELRGHPLPRLRGALQPAQIIDLLAILPFFLGLLFPNHLDLRFLRAIRLIRALKLMRFSRASRTLLTVLQSEWPVIGAAIFIMSIFVIVTASVGYLFEHTAQPDKFENIPQSIYWAVITLASVGYGDISPVTEGGRIATVIASLAGIGIFALPAAILSSAFVDQLHQDRERLREEIRQALEHGPFTEASRQALLDKSEDLSLNEREIDETIRQVIEQAGREASRQHHSMRQGAYSDPAQLSPRQAQAAVQLHLAWLRSLQAHHLEHPEARAALLDALEKAPEDRAAWLALERSAEQESAGLGPEAGKGLGQTGY